MDNIFTTATMVLLVALSVSSTLTNAQSISTGSATKIVTKNVEKSFFDVSYTSRSGACHDAKVEANKYAKSVDASSISLADCDCSISKRRLRGNEPGIYNLATGKFYAGDDVDVHECGVNARMVVDERRLK
jgi:hypothetical protein